MGVSVFKVLRCAVPLHSESNLFFGPLPRTGPFCILILLALLQQDALDIFNSFPLVRKSNFLFRGGNMGFFILGPLEG